MKHSQQRSNVAPGMTLVEIAVAVAVIGIVIGVLIPALRNVTGKAKRSSTETALRNIDMAIDEFKRDTGKYPTSLYDLVERPQNPEVAKRWKQPYVHERTIEKDAFNNEFVYYPAPGKKPPYELYSWGTNGEGSPEVEWIRPENA